MSNIERVTIALPKEILGEVDELKTKNFANRSHMIVRIIQEWKLLRAGKNPGTQAVVIEPNTDDDPAKVIAGHEQPEPCAA